MIIVWDIWRFAFERNQHNLNDYLKLATTCCTFHDLCTESLVHQLYIPTSTPSRIKPIIMTMLRITRWSERAKQLLIQYLYDMMSSIDSLVALLYSTFLRYRLPSFETKEEQDDKITVFLLRLWVQSLFLRCPGSQEYYRPSCKENVQVCAGLSEFLITGATQYHIFKKWISTGLPEFFNYKKVHKTDVKYTQIRDEWNSLTHAQYLSLDTFLNIIMKDSPIYRMMNTCFHGVSYFRISFLISKSKTLAQLLGILTYLFHTETIHHTVSIIPCTCTLPLDLNGAFRDDRLVPNRILNDEQIEAQDVQNTYDNVPSFFELYEKYEKTDQIHTQDIINDMVQYLSDQEKERYHEYEQWIYHEPIYHEPIYHEPILFQILDDTSDTDTSDTDTSDTDTSDTDTDTSS